MPPIHITYDRDSNIFYVHPGRQVPPHARTPAQDPSPGQIIEHVRRCNAFRGSQAARDCAETLRNLEHFSTRAGFRFGDPNRYPILPYCIQQANLLVESIFSRQMPESVHCINANWQRCRFDEGHRSGPIGVVIVFDPHVNRLCFSYLQKPPPGLPSILIVRVPQNG